MGQQAEVNAGERFEFGKNWSEFLRTLNSERIENAKESLRDMLGVETLDNVRFLDAGCGSGLFSLAARSLGAEVHSFDYDLHSVACANELRNRSFPDDPAWTVEEGSVLDKGYLSKLGRFDVVYSWGVLHHTGDMRSAFENVASLVAENGLLFISIYNYQPVWTKVWKLIKKAYNQSPRPMRKVILGLVVLWYESAKTVQEMLRLKNPWPPKRWREYRRNRGMSLLHDYVDWVGGWPFEAARPEGVFDFFREKGFALERLKTCAGRHGCNEFVFKRLGG